MKKGKTLLYGLIALTCMQYLSSCCGCACHGTQGGGLYIWGDSAKKIEITYYAGRLGDKTEIVTMPFMAWLDKTYCDDKKFYIKICDTSVSVKGLIGDCRIGDSCNASYILYPYFHPEITNSSGYDTSRFCKNINPDSVFNYLKKIKHPGYIEVTKGSTKGCQAAVEY